MPIEDRNVLEILKSIDEKLGFMIEMNLPLGFRELLNSLEKHISKCNKFEKIKTDDAGGSTSVYCSCKSPKAVWIITESFFPSYAHKKMFYEELDKLNKKHKSVEIDKEDIGNATEGLEI